MVVGAGYIGLELGSVWRRLGAKVSVIEFLPRIVPTADQEMGDLLKKSLTKQGLEFHLETKVTGASIEGDRATVHAEKKDGKKLDFECDRVLVAVGRRPYTQGLGLAEVGRRGRSQDRQGAGGRPFPDQCRDDLGDRRPDRRPDAGPQGGRRGDRLSPRSWRASRATSITTRSRA